MNFNHLNVWKVPMNISWYISLMRYKRWSSFNISHNLNDKVNKLNLLLFLRVTNVYQIWCIHHGRHGKTKSLIAIGHSNETFRYDMSSANDIHNKRFPFHWLFTSWKRMNLWLNLGKIKLNGYTRSEPTRPRQDFPREKLIFRPKFAVLNIKDFFLEQNFFVWDKLWNEYGTRIFLTQ